MMDELLALAEFTQKFASITRTVKLGPREVFENDAEHSYQVGLVSWYISEKLGLRLDRQKILTYALVHDLVEVYAGDTDPHRSSKEYIDSKEERERLAFEKIKNDFPTFSSLHDAIETYESHQDKESKLVYMMDKILPIINTYLSKHSYYVDNNISFEKWRKWIKEKSKIVDAESVFGEDFFEQLIHFFENRKEVFAKD